MVIKAFDEMLLLLSFANVATFQLEILGNRKHSKLFRTIIYPSSEYGHAYKAFIAAVYIQCYCFNTGVIIQYA